MNAGRVAGQTPDEAWLSLYNATMLGVGIV
jgi:hypothetical protein